jgi:hypothetical protein
MRSTQVPYWSGVFNSTARTSFASTMACSRRAHLRFSAHRRRAAAPPTRACARRAATPTRSTASASVTRSCLTHDRSLGQGSGSPSVTPFPAQSPKDFGGNGQNTSEFRIAEPFLPLDSILAETAKMRDWPARCGAGAFLKKSGKRSGCVGLRSCRRRPQRPRRPRGAQVRRKWSGDIFVRETDRAKRDPAVPGPSMTRSTVGLNERRDAVAVRNDLAARDLRRVRNQRVEVLVADPLRDERL